MFNDDSLHASMCFYQIFCDFGGNADISIFFPVYRLFNESIDKEIGSRGGGEGKLSSILVWCQLENILTC